jgi:hypothetical protein
MKRLVLFISYIKSVSRYNTRICHLIPGKVWSCGGNSGVVGRGKGANIRKRVTLLTFCVGVAVLLECKGAVRKCSGSGTLPPPSEDQKNSLESPTTCF